MRDLVAVMVAAIGTFAVQPEESRAQGIPFKHKVEVYHDETGDVMAFSLLLEQPFFAEEFEKSNYLRLQALDGNAYLIYPKETKFRQKHAAFYGRLRGSGQAQVRLSYEIVSEELDGSRRVEVRQGGIEIPIPSKRHGPKSVYLEWARQQNVHFLNLLSYYPHETFLQYCLLQSRDRYGIEPPKLPHPTPARGDLEVDLYEVVTGALAIQEALQRYRLGTEAEAGDLKIHISELTAPAVKSLPYAKLLEEKRERENATPKVHGISKLVPDDQYFLHFNSMRSFGELLDLTKDWGGSVLRLLAVQARNNLLQEKFEEQLLLKRDVITQLFADEVLAEMAMSGSDLFLVEGTDVTFVFRLKRPELFEVAAERWLTEAREKRPDLVEREFHYRGHRVAARYTEDRVVSSFAVRHDDYMIYSNSHAAIRKVVDTIAGVTPCLHDALDYQYVSTILPPSEDLQAGYFYASEAFIRQQIDPGRKISEKRRVECFNNLIMLNNASLFYRLEHGKSPTSLSDLVEGRFIDPAKLVCPHGGAYAFDAKHDAGTCSLHNRLKYLTPNAELSVLRVSEQEQREYKRYKNRYEAFWQRMFDPIAVRIRVRPALRLELCVLPFANSSLYRDLQRRLEDQPQVINATRIARSTFVSVGAVLGRRRAADYLRTIPGIPDVLAADPTLTDLSWIGDRVSVHLCDDNTILEVDPSRLQTLRLLGEVSVAKQTVAAIAMLAASLPAYVTIDVEDREKAQRFLDLLSSRIFLKADTVAGLPVTFDAYRLPNYSGHANYVVSYGLYALKVRLHMALIGERLVAATRSQALHEVIDAAETRATTESPPAHMVLQFRLRALRKFKDDLGLYWAEKSRIACHGNIISLYNLVKLYEIPIADVNRLSEAKYGVRYACPDGGSYRYDVSRDEVECTVHGNRRNSRQNLGLSEDGSFSRFIDSLDEVVARLRFRDDSLIATVEIVRREKAEAGASQ